MLILIEELSIDLDNQAHRFALENILIAHYHGNCFALTKSRNLIKNVAEDFRICDRARMAILDIKEKITYSLPLIDGRILYMKTSGIGSDCPSKTDFGWHVNISFFSMGDLLEKPYFIGESLKDIDLYHFSGRHFLLEKDIHREVNLSFRENPGGGGSTYDMLKRVVTTSACPVLCIVDSDKNAPTGNIKSTAKNAKKVDLIRDSNSLYVLPVRAAENTIPKRLLTSIFDEHKSYIDNMFDDINDIPFGYANLKYQNTLSSILKCNEETVKRDWLDWISRKNPPLNQKCLADTECPRKNCKCFLTPSFSENCLDKVTEYLEKNSIQRTAKESKESIKGVWRDIGHLVASHFASSKGVRIS